MDNENLIKSINGNNIPLCNIMGVKIAAVNMEWLVNFTKENLSSLKGNYFCFSNVHSTVLSFDDEKYCNVQNGGALALPDGGPLADVGKKRGFENMERTTGPSYMEEIFKLSSEMNYTHFFYGSTDDTLEKIQANLKNKYPDIKIVGTYSPPFRELEKDEDEKIVDLINSKKPDFLWVGLGAPKQEIWMYNHKNKINSLMLGVGAGFDYFAGNIKRAPQWMQNHSLEWLYRLVQDPKRLFKRYLYTNTKFIYNVAFKGR